MQSTRKWIGQSVELFSKVFQKIDFCTFVLSQTFCNFTGSEAKNRIFTPVRANHPAIHWKSNHSICWMSKERLIFVVLCSVKVFTLVLKKISSSAASDRKKNTFSWNLWIVMHPANLQLLALAACTVITCIFETTDFTCTHMFWPLSITLSSHLSRKTPALQLPSTFLDQNFEKMPNKTKHLELKSAFGIFVSHQNSVWQTGAHKLKHTTSVHAHHFQTRSPSHSTTQILVFLAERGPCNTLLFDVLLHGKPSINSDNTVEDVRFLSRHAHDDKLD